jgi:hypothetical protein
MTSVNIILHESFATLKPSTVYILSHLENTFFSLSSIFFLILVLILGNTLSTNAGPSLFLLPLVSLFARVSNVPQVDQH